jgi:hypothetical protein
VRGKNSIRLFSSGSRRRKNNQAQMDRLQERVLHSQAAAYVRMQGASFVSRGRGRGSDISWCGVGSGGSWSGGDSGNGRFSVAEERVVVVGEYEPRKKKKEKEIE